MKGVVVFAAFAVTLAGDLQTAVAGDPMTSSKALIDFTDADRSKWYVINDGVMGGESQSQIQRTERETGLFTGELSLENNGGFASARAVVGRHDLSAHVGLEIRARGDGRTYQLRLRTDDGFDGIAYRARFETRDGEWTTTRISFDDFLPTFRGRMLNNARRLDTTRIQQVTLMLADKKPGPFSLEVDFVRTWGPAR
jgi:monofunctional biosynthetic peptidoglycan transglycosylase